MSLTQCIFVSARLRRWYSLHRLHSARPRYFEVRNASFRACAPAVVGFQGLAFLRGGSEGTSATGSSACPNAAAPRSPMASWHFRVS